MTVQQLAAALSLTAIDIEAAGVDRDSGYGLVDAYSAFSLVPPSWTPTPTPTRTPNGAPTPTGTVPVASSPTGSAATPTATRTASFTSPPTATAVPTAPGTISDGFVQAWPGAINFSDAVIGQMGGGLPVIMRVVSANPIFLLSISTQGPMAADFVVSGTPAGNTVYTSNTSTGFQVAFLPTGVGARNASVKIAYQRCTQISPPVCAATIYELGVSVTGTGLPPPTATPSGPTPTPGAVSFSDTFDRSDSTDVGNGWTEVFGNVGISGNRLVAVNNAAVYRSLPIALPVHVQAQLVGCGPNGDGFVHFVTVRGENNDSYGGYGIELFQNPGAGNSTQVVRYDNGVQIDQALINAPQAMTGPVSVDASFHEDGSISGTVAGTNRMATFSFAPRSVNSGGSKLHLRMEGAQCASPFNSMGFDQVAVDGAAPAPTATATASATAVATATGTPGGSCCGAKPDRGCGDAACRSVVCAGSIWCCEVQWDEACAAEALVECDCGTATPTVTSTSIPPTPTATASRTATSTRTVTATNTPSTTQTPVSTRTRTPTITPISTRTNTPPPGIGIPTITAPSDGQVLVVGGVSFAWTTVANATGYDLRIVNAANATVFSGALVGIGSTSTLISLPQNGSYTFRARACVGGFSDAQCGGFAARAFSISAIAPSAAPTVVAPSAGAILINSITGLSWTAVTAAGGLPIFYEVDLKSQATGIPELQILLPDPTLSTVARLHSGAYQVRVRACQAACGPWSSTVPFSATISPMPNTAPTIINAVVSGGNSLAVNWSAVGGAEWYQLFVIQPPPAGPGGGALTVAAREVVGTNIAALPLPAGAASILIAACTGNGCGPFSAPKAISAGGPNPSAPQIGQPLGGSVVDGPGVFFSWNRVPGDNGSNTTYRLYVQDLSRATAALDVLTTQNFYAAYFRSEGARYDALIVANPGPTQVIGPAAGFNVRGQSAAAPTMTQPTHNSTVSAGNIQLGWSPVPGATLYEYYVSAGGVAPTRGVTPGLVVQVPLTAVGGAPTSYNGIVRACPAGAVCVPGTDAGWGPWSTDAGPGVTHFTVL